MGIKSKTKRLIYGVGINDADYSTRLYRECPRINGKRKQELVWMCPYYVKWKDMLKRVYSPSFTNKYPTYKNCTVCEEWLTFSNFKAWMETQDWQGKHLDKDILIRGNKHYSPATCVFVDVGVNLFVLEADSRRGEWPLGVYFNIRDNKFQAQCRNPFSGKTENLGLFSCQNEAHFAWVARKLELAKLLASEQNDSRVAEALIDRYENYGNKQ